MQEIKRVDEWSVGVDVDTMNPWDMPCLQTVEAQPSHYDAKGVHEVSVPLVPKVPRTELSMTIDKALHHETPILLLLLHSLEGCPYMRHVIGKAQYSTD